MGICPVETRRVAKFGNNLNNVHSGNVRQEMKINTAPDNKLFLTFISFFRNKKFLRKIYLVHYRTSDCVLNVLLSENGFFFRQTSLA